MTRKKIAEHEAWHAVLWIRIGCKVKVIRIKEAKGEGVTEPDRLKLNYKENPPEKYDYNAFSELGIYAPHVIATLVAYVATYVNQDVDHWNSAETDMDTVIRYLCCHNQVSYDLEKAKGTKVYSDWKACFEKCITLIADENYLKIVNALVEVLLVEDIVFWNRIEEIVYPFFKENNWKWV
jgi:hypothetical protein